MDYGLQVLASQEKTLELNKSRVSVALQVKRYLEYLLWYSHAFESESGDWENIIQVFHYQIHLYRVEGLVNLYV